jgi:hypothetical protein
MPADMFLERRTVSPKTPLDGRLEITRRVAARCEELGVTFEVELADRRTPARIGTLECTCRGVGNPHVHYFIDCAALMKLVPGHEVDLHMDAAAKVVRVSPVRPDA